MSSKKITGICSIILLSVITVFAICLKFKTKSSDNQVKNHTALVSISDDAKTVVESENFTKKPVTSRCITEKPETSAHISSVSSVSEVKVTNTNEVKETLTNNNNKISDNEKKNSVNSVDYSTKQLFNTQDELIDYINLKAAENSPLDIGYQDAGYNRIYDEYYDVSFTDKGYICTLSNMNSFGGNQDLRYRNYLSCSYTFEEASKKKLNNEELSEFSRLFDYINKTVRKDNYYIYDVYQFDFNEEYTTEGKSAYHKIDTNGKTNYIAEIVLNDYYEKYKERNYRKDDFVVSFEICNDHIIKIDYCSIDPNNRESEYNYNAEIYSEYPLFRRSHELFDEFYSEVSRMYSDCTVCNGYISYRDMESSEVIRQPVTSWIKDTVSGDEYYYCYMSPYCIFCQPEGKEDISDENFYMGVSFYFKPGTTQDTVISHLKELKPLFDKYNIIKITTDILKNEDDFERYRNSKGYICDFLIDSYTDQTINSLDRYHAVYSDNFRPWGAR